MMTSFAGCLKRLAAPDDLVPLAERVKAAPDGFTFATSREVQVNLRLLTSTNSPLKGVVVTLLQPGGKPEDGVLFKGASDVNGYVKGLVAVPSYLDTVLVQPNYPGLVNNARCLITQDVLSGILGGPNGYGGNIVPEALPKEVQQNGTTVFVADENGVDFNYPSPYRNTSEAVKSPISTGIPKYLEANRDYIDQTGLDYIAATFPEGSAKSVITIHPEYLTSAINTIDISKNTTVYLTFVSEGAAYTNSLAYYTYPTGRPPQRARDITGATVIFPNFSANGSKGGLVAGDKVRLGTFTAGTSIGFIVMQAAWTGSGVSVSTQKFYSTSALNPESSDAYQRHSFVLYDDVHQLFLLGFEDLHRLSPSSNPDRVSADNDFNDLLFYVTGDGITSAGVSAISITLDRDKDGVNDLSDEFPDDAARAFTETTPWRTLAFEDLWPLTGDYDMNDLVVQYRYRYVKNADNNIVEFTGDYKVQAAGAIYNDGFGVEFPFAPSLVKSVTGQRRLHTNFIVQAANGLEAEQTKAVIIPFDDYHAVIPNSSNTDPMINTKASLPKVEGELVSVKVEFNSPVAPSVMGTAPFNPFLIGNFQRGFEVHLSGKAITARANPLLLGTGNDRSTPLTGKYFQTANNWPWAIDIAGTFQHPVEGTAITTAYPHFLDWAQAGGGVYADWYTNTASGYRSPQGIFSK